MAHRALTTFVASRVPAPSLRVLFVSSMWPTDERPDYGSFVASQARSLEAAGVLVDVLAIRGDTSMAAYPASRSRIVRLTRSGAYDLVHVHTGHAATVGVLRVGCPVVLSYVGGDLLGHPKKRGPTLKSRTEVMVFRQFARAAHATITKSEEMQWRLPAAVRARNHVIPNGVDIERFAPVPRSCARELLGWHDDESVALFVGDPADARKNLGLAQAVVREVCATGVEVRLHVAWGVDPESMPSLMSAANALIFTSRSEGSPNVIKEAMAAELPIVAAPVGDVLERLAGVPGCYVESANPAEMGQALARALNDGRAPAARQAVTALSLGAIADRVIAVYRSVLSASRL